MPTEFPMQSFNQNVIKHKTGLLNLAAKLGNISKPCRIMAFPGIPFTAIRPPVMRAESRHFLRSAAESRT